MMYCAPGHRKKVTQDCYDDHENYNKHQLMIGRRKQTHYSDADNTLMAETIRSPIIKRTRRQR